MHHTCRQCKHRCLMPRCALAFDRLLRSLRSGPSPRFRNSSGPRRGKPWRDGSKSRRTLGPALCTNKHRLWGAVIALFWVMQSFRACVMQHYEQIVGSYDSAAPGHVEL
eukprot:1161817-Pelagomonas_calceolata.AAC.7